MKTPLLKLLTRILLTAIFINLLGAGFVAIFDGLPVSYFDTLIGKLGILTLQMLIAIAFVGLSGGLLLWFWAWQVAWTPAKKTISWILVTLAIGIPSVLMLLGNTYSCLPAMLFPAALIWTWSPSEKEKLHLVKESEAGPKLCLLTRHTAALLQSLLLGLPVMAMIFGLGIFLKYHHADTDYYFQIGYMSVLAGSFVCITGWTVIWWPLIHKTRRMIALSIIALLVAGNIESIFSIILHSDKYYDMPDHLYGFSLAIIYMTLTLFIWRTSRLQQRRQLLDSPQYAEFNATPYCVECGFNMTGLKKLRCPECGQEYTLAELIFENVRIRDLDMQLDPLPFKDITATG